jgi:hypothetical protein
MALTSGDFFDADVSVFGRIASAPLPESTISTSAVAATARCRDIKGSFCDAIVAV